MSTDSYIAYFKNEASDLLNDAENSFISIETADDYTQEYNSVFRALHSLKGTAGMLELKELESHMHSVESLFSNFKDKKHLLNDLIISYFLASIDKARCILQGRDFVFEVQTFQELSNGTKTPSIALSELKERKQKIETKKTIKENGVVFIVDDEKKLTQIIQEMIEQEGYIIYAFTSPLDLLEKLKEVTPDLILSDFKMPEMDGLEMAKKVFVTDEDVPIVFISACMTKEIMTKSLDIGVFTFLDKPIKEMQLIAVCRNAIARSRASHLLTKSLNHIQLHYYQLIESIRAQDNKELLEEYKREVRSIMTQKAQFKSLFKRKSLGVP